ncbi:MAG: alpha/beta hydrolase [Rikenellaceae bacterium]
MKKIFSLICFAIIPKLFFAQALSFQEADNLAREIFPKAMNEYAGKIENNWNSALLKSGNYQMPFEYYINGECPNNGFALYISMHGGGGTTQEENDKQWQNQKTLYGNVNGIYFVPRAPTNTWNMWHQEYMDDFLKQIITYSVARLNADPSRIYLLGYSAGGDGVYNLATRLSDKFAAAAMMAGHPGDAKIENLRNLAFAIYMGANDTAYNRSALASEWLRDFQRLNGEDNNGFEYNINIFEGKGHWMDNLDSSAISWLSAHSRRSNPERIIWIQDDVVHTHKYNLEVSNPKQGFRLEERVNYDNNTIYLYSNDYREVTVWLDDYILNLDKTVTVFFNDKKVFSGMVPRLENNIRESIKAHLDPQHVYWGKVRVNY